MRCGSGMCGESASLDEASAKRAGLLLTEYDEPEDEAAAALTELNAIEVQP